MEQPEAVVNTPSPTGYRLIAEQYMHEVLQSVNREKGKRKAVAERIQSMMTIAVHLAMNAPEQYAQLIDRNPFASKTRVSWEELKSLR